MRRWLIVVVVFAFVAAACSSGGDGDESADPAGEDTATGGDEDAAEPVAADDGDAAPPADEPAPAPEVTIPDYADQVRELALAEADSALPPAEPEVATGSYGYSRYVYSQDGDLIIPTLIEGPRGQQIRCQDLERDCSYLELKALHESGDEVPDYLGMDRDTLGELVGQLDRTNETVRSYPTIEDACAAGMLVSSSQNANMGIHVVNPGGTTFEFDPSRPQMILFAKDGGEQLTREEQGTCQDGTWTGEPGYRSVGAVFTLPMTPDHPDAFAGPIDNWHIHFNTCAGSRSEGGAGREDLDEIEEQVVFSRERCESSGGRFLDVIPTWMMHAYVEPEHDSQGGVFAMFNPSIWPLAESPEEIRELRTAELEGAYNATINNFDFGEVSVDVGETVVFSNSDSVPHTVTAGLPSEPSTAFDSGILGTGGSYELSFDEPGEYALFCALHPGMTGTVNVG